MVECQLRNRAVQRGRAGNVCTGLYVYVGEVFAQLGLSIIIQVNMNVMVFFM